MLSILQSIILVFAICTFIGALISQIVFMLTHKNIAKLSARYRERVLRILVIFPVLATVVILIKGFAPSYLTLFGYPQDHCITHCIMGNIEHIHLCLVTPVAFISNPIILSLFFSLIGIFIFNVYKTVAELITSKKLITQFKSISKKVPEKYYYKTETDEIFAISMGVFRPAVFISSGLENKLTTSELKLVLSHEHAHSKRKDLLRILVLKFFGIFFLPKILNRILSDLSLASEQICDECAAQSVKSRLLVAETILKVQKLVPTLNAPSKVANFFSENHISSRINVLLENVPAAQDKLFWIFTYSLLFLALIFVLLEQNTFHYLTEIIYSILL